MSYEHIDDRQKRDEKTFSRISIKIPIEVIYSARRTEIQPIPIKT